MKKYTIILIILVLCVSFSVPQAWAGSRQRHRWEGVAIGVGAAIVGAAILDNHARSHRDRHYRHEPAYYRHHPPKHRRQGLRHHRRHHRGDGHWEVQRVWVPAKVEKVWNPGHYNRRNRWVPGRWIEIERQPGYWTEERVWVAYR